MLQRKEFQVYLQRIVWNRSLVQEIKIKPHIEDYVTIIMKSAAICKGLRFSHNTIVPTQSCQILLNITKTLSRSQLGPQQLDEIDRFKVSMSGLSGSYMLYTVSQLSRSAVPMLYLKLVLSRDICLLISGCHIIHTLRSGMKIVHNLNNASDK